MPAIVAPSLRPLGAEYGLDLRNLLDMTKPDLAVALHVLDDQQRGATDDKHWNRIERVRARVAEEYARRLDTEQEASRNAHPNS